MQISYETDVVAWANEQAGLIRSGQFHLLDLQHIAEEIEDVGKSEKRELASRMAVLLAHLLKWQFQPSRRSVSWERTVKVQRRAIASHLKSVPSLKPSLSDEEWLDKTWADATVIASSETGLDDFPEVCAWSMADVLTEGWLPA